MKNLNIIFQEKNLKHTIMTETYGAKKGKSLMRFKEKISWDRIENKLEKLEIEDIFKNFFDFLQKNELILEHGTRKITEMVLKNNIIEYFDKSKSNLIYFKTESQQKEIKHKNKRITKKIQIITTERDIRKMILSSKANYIQSIDGCLVRWYFIDKNKAITIHDCFMVDYMQVSFLIAKINEGMRVEFHITEEVGNDYSRIFSIFILL